VALERAHDAGALVQIIDLGIARIDVGRNLPLLEHAIGRILERGLDQFRRKAKAFGHAFGEAPGFVVRRHARARLRGQQFEMAPERHAIPAPEQRERPARQWLARIPFSLAVVQQTARREAVVQAADQFIGAQALARAQRIRVPFGRLIVVDRNECRLAPHREPNVVGRELGIDAIAERVQCGPGFVGERQRHPRLLGDPVQSHVEREFNLGGPDQAADRRCRAVMRARREWQVAFAAKQARGRIEADPAGPR
jgi:hypothetical protein